MNREFNTVSKKKLIISIISVIVAIALYIFGELYYLHIRDGEVQLHFIDVGQGDAALILTDSAAVLVDAGTTDSGGKVAAYVKNYTDSLDYMILSHPHEDHIGGAEDVIENVDVKNVIMPNKVEDSICFDRTLDAIEKENATVHPADAGGTYDIDGIRMEILSPYANKDYEETNNVSIVVKITYGCTSFLFTGDAEKPIEEELLKSGADLDCDVLKVGHHGSSTSSSRDFVEAVSPDIAVISCGKDNSYGHPHYEVTNLMKSLDITVLRTDKQGSIVLSSDGYEVIVKRSSDSVF